jgi:hypothetical protein
MVGNWGAVQYLPSSSTSRRRRNETGGRSAADGARMIARIPGAGIVPVALEFTVRIVGHAVRRAELGLFVVGVVAGRAGADRGRQGHRRQAAAHRSAPPAGVVAVDEIAQLRAAGAEVIAVTRQSLS